MADTKWDPEVSSVAGSEYMDETDPGWQDEIDWDRLRMESQGYCVLGQRRGTYVEAMRELGLSREDCFRLGFAVPEDVNQRDDYAYRKLADAWRRRKAERE